MFTMVMRLHGEDIRGRSFGSVSTALYELWDFRALCRKNGFDVWCWLEDQDGYLVPGSEGRR